MNAMDKISIHLVLDKAHYIEYFDSFFPPQFILGKSVEAPLNSVKWKFPHSGQEIASPISLFPSG